MEIIIGIGVLLILTIIIIFEFGILRKMREKPNEMPQKVELTDEQKKKQEKLRENFENLMGFDYEKALKSSKGE